MTRDPELDEYFTLHEDSRIISYIPPENCSPSIKSFLELGSIEIKLIDKFFNEYNYETEVDIKDPICELPSFPEAPKSMILSKTEFSYTIMNGEKHFKFDKFTTNNTCCDMEYTYQVNNNVGQAMVTKFDS